MCGIVGYIGKRNAVPFLLQGLEKLEYRGYDSSGIAINSSKGIEVIKKQGRLGVVKNIVESKPDFCSSLGIGHTRWATHGSPSDLNSHPHVSSCGKIALVHNGIIENYIEIKKNLIEKGFDFKSDTDSEVIVQLISSLYKNDIFSAVKKAVKILEGSFALGIICKDNPNVLIAVNKDSPVIIGAGTNENFIASDIPALLSETRIICRLPEKQIALIKATDFELYDFDGRMTQKNFTTVNWEVNAAEKNGYEHFMLKEIMEQPEVIKATLSPRISGPNLKLDNAVFSKEYLKNLNKICIVACGSAYHVGCVAKYFMEKLLRKTVEVDLASEFRYRCPIIDKNTLVIVISQSGETADSIAALREAKLKGARILSIVNVIGSTIASESDDVLYTHAGPEIAVATTKAYSAQLIVIYILGLYLAKSTQKINDENLSLLVKKLQNLPYQIENTLKYKEEVFKLAKKYYKYEKVFFIGRNLDYAVCMEGSLKLKEISYVHSEAYAAGELKHGPIALVEDGTYIIGIITNPNIAEKTLSNLEEVITRGANVILITNLDIANDKMQIIKIPEVKDITAPILAIVPLQLIAYYIAKEKGLDVDKPRNLAKSVTVE